MGQISGVVLVRPVRAALVVTSDVGAVRQAVHCATSTWGGLHHLVVTAGKPDAALELARKASVDVVHPVGEDAACQDLAQATGFQWRGRGRWGPFSEPTEYMSSRLLGPEICLEQAGEHRFTVQWDADDPLAALYTVWFGQYGDSEYQQELAAQFTYATSTHVFHSSEPMPAIGEGVTPIQLTALDIEYQGEGQPLGFMLVDPANPVDLMTFWNIRACGGRVWPWPLGYGDHVHDAADAWLRAALQSGTASHIRSGTGEDLGVHVAVWATDPAASIPTDLEQFLSEHKGIYHFLHAETWDTPQGYRGQHPLATDYTRSIAVTVSKDERSLAVPMPALPITAPHNARSQPRIITADVKLFRESGFTPEETVAVPHTRMLTPLLTGYPNFPETFHRPTPDGRAIGMSYSADQVVIGTVPILQVFQTLLDGSGWKCGRSDSGLFVARLIELLGGIRTQAGNQPAIRRILDEAARAPHGVPVPRLVQTAKDHQGRWPDNLASQEAGSTYPREVVNYLLARKVLRPLLPVKCPTCTTVAYLPPEDLATEVHCDMCSAVSPLGLILALDAKPSTWNVRTASALTAERVAETMPIMACLSILTAAVSPGGGLAPHMLGLTVASGKSWSCEIDIVLSTSRTSAPTVVIGEIKSYRDSITATDLANLGKVQAYLRSNGVECIVLAGTLREQLEDDEIQALRDYCESSPAEPLYRSGSLQPVLPIVLTSGDLSVPEHTDEHPTSWERGRFGLLNLAQESCRRNLGLDRVDYTGGGTALRCLLTWTT